MTRVLRRWWTEEDGQDLVEYALLLATVGLTSLVAMSAFDDVIRTVYTGWDTGTQNIWEPQDPQ